MSNNQLFFALAGLMLTLFAVGVLYFERDLIISRLNEIEARLKRLEKRPN